MRIGEIMTRPVQTVGPMATLEEARQSMHLHEVRHLIVVEEGRVLGVLSDRDLGGPNPATRSLNGLVRTRMIEDVVTATPRTSVREAANLLRGHRIGCLPVLEGGKLRGIITTTDLLDLLGSGAEAPSLGKKRAIMKTRKPKLRQNLPR